ncbi:MAG: ABC transporter ATP-binding protein [Erythrobacter sp.]
MQLAVSQLGKAYAGRTVLDDISFTLGAGERLLLLGPSGSGKSTLLNIICALERPDSGEVRLGDGVLASATGGAKGAGNGDALRRANIAIIFQNLRLISALTITGNLALAQKLQTGRSDRAACVAMLDRLGIANRADARPFELSQGEAQRAAIARALVVRPKLLIADEPTSALDHANARIVAELLDELAREAGASLLVATHDERLMPYFPRHLMLAQGRLAA